LNCEKCDEPANLLAVRGILAGNEPAHSVQPVEKAIDERPGICDSPLPPGAQDGFHGLADPLDVLEAHGPCRALQAVCCTVDSLERSRIRCPALFYAEKSGPYGLDVLIGLLGKGSSQPREEFVVVHVEGRASSTG
jgi:hypothetical protein